MEEDGEVDIDSPLLKKKKLKGDIVVLFALKENSVTVKSRPVLLDEHNSPANGIVTIVPLAHH